MSTAPDGHHASENYDAELDSAHDGAWRAAARWVAGIADAFFGGDGSEAAGATVVVRRIDNDAEVLRITASTIDEAEAIVATVRRDLERMTREEFLTEWGGTDDVQGDGLGRPAPGPGV